MSTITTAPHEHAPLDVSSLPTSSFDSKSPLWWGNLLMIFIETATIILLITSYYYCRRNFEQWPPPKTDPLPSMVHPLPLLGAATTNVVLLALSCIPMYLTDRAARRGHRRAVLLGLAALILISAASLWLRWKEFPATHFSWGDNAYASIVWTTLGLHLTYILAGLLEFFIMGLWLTLHELDAKHALDVTLAGGYWYWVAGTNLLIYFTIFLSPRFI